MKIAKIEPLFVSVSQKSNWSFFRVTTAEGITGLGEATLQGWEDVQLACLRRIQGQLIGKTLEQGKHPPLVDGHYPIPDAPGAGMELNEDVVHAHPWRELAPGQIRAPKLG